jgi:hypothetical protein
MSSIKAVHVHPMFKDRFDASESKYDVSILEVQLNLKPEIAEAKALAADDETHEPGTVCKVAGFGLTHVCISRGETLTH